jgi:membrane-bound lytic murein transglycosylase D
MEGTARCMGLRIDDYVDERINPERSAKAALKYLFILSKDSSNSLDFGIVSYNCGPVPVANARRLNPEIKDDFEIPSRLLKEETLRYNSRIDATYTILQNPRLYGLEFKADEIKFKRYTTKKGDNLNRIARKFKASKDLIRQYNGLKNPSKLPRDYSLLIPLNSKK